MLKLAFARRASSLRSSGLMNVARTRLTLNFTRAPIRQLSSRKAYGSTHLAMVGCVSQRDVATTAAAIVAVWMVYLHIFSESLCVGDAMAVFCHCFARRSCNNRISKTIEKAATFQSDLIPTCDAYPRLLFPARGHARCRDIIEANHQSRNKFVVLSVVLLR